jgi:hypothetical protein
MTINFLCNCKTSYLIRAFPATLNSVFNKFNHTFKSDCSLNLYINFSRNIIMNPFMCGGMYGPGMYGPGMYGPGMYGPGMYGPGMYGAGMPPVVMEENYFDGGPYGMYGGYGNGGGGVMAGLTGLAGLGIGIGLGIGLGRHRHHRHHRHCW